MQWLKKTDLKFKSKDNKPIEVWELCHTRDPQILSAWAKHFREQYCLESDIDKLRDGTGLSRYDYLTNLKFPDITKSPGPSIRAGDFAEILAADYLEYYLKHWVPRTRYRDKAIRNESVKGADTIGFLVKDANNPCLEDTLTIIESKAKYSGSAKGKLQEAIEHSSKDELREAESLNAMKQRILASGQEDKAKRIARFQNEADRPFTHQYIAAVHLDSKHLPGSALNEADTSSHCRKDQLLLVVIHGKDMMKLVNALYERAAIEA